MYMYVGKYMYVCTVHVIVRTTCTYMYMYYDHCPKLAWCMCAYLEVYNIILTLLYIHVYTCTCTCIIVVWAAIAFSL